MIKQCHGEVNYDLTQFLSEDGGYRTYLSRFGRMTVPLIVCDMIQEDVEHIVFNCPRFATRRAEVERLRDGGAVVTREYRELL